MVMAWGWRCLLSPRSLSLVFMAHSFLSKCYRAGLLVGEMAKKQAT